MIRPRLHEVFGRTAWQMSLGERAAFEGVLALLEPALAIEIGSAEGSSLERVAAHSREVHSVDLVEPDEAAQLPNVRVHTGDSHAILPALLHQFSEQGRTVDFAHVDGDHSSEGVRRDLEDLLGSPAVGQAVILVHDVSNEHVRAGLEAVPFATYEKVIHVDLDFVPGGLFRAGQLQHELWGGFGLVMIDASGAEPDPDPSDASGRYSAYDLLVSAKAHRLRAAAG